MIQIISAKRFQFFAAILAALLRPSSARAEGMAFGAGGGFDGLILGLIVLGVVAPLAILIFFLVGFARIWARKSPDYPVAPRSVPIWFGICLVLGILAIAAALGLLGYMLVEGGFRAENLYFGLISAAVSLMLGLWSIQGAFKVRKATVKKNESSSSK